MWRWRSELATSNCTCPCHLQRRRGKVVLLSSTNSLLLFFNFILMVHWIFILFRSREVCVGEARRSRFRYPFGFAGAELYCRKIGISRRWIPHWKPPHARKGLSRSLALFIHILSRFLSRSVAHTLWDNFLNSLNLSLQTFQQWADWILAPKGCRVKDMGKSWSDGLLLINLASVLLRCVWERERVREMEKDILTPLTWVELSELMWTRTCIIRSQRAPRR